MHNFILSEAHDKEELTPVDLFNRKTNMHWHMKDKSPSEYARSSDLSTANDVLVSYII